MVSIQRRRGHASPWIVRWTETGRPRSRSWKYKATAEAFARRVEQAAARGITVAQLDELERLTVARWLDRWLDDVIRARVINGQLKPRTAQDYESVSRVHLTPLLGDLPLVALTPADVERALGRVQQTATARTAVKVRNVLSRALRDAERAGLLERNVARVAEPPRPDNPAPAVLAPAELAAALDQARTHRLGPLFLLALLTGLRSNELRGLRWDDVDLDAGILTVRRGMHHIPKAAARVARPGETVTAPKTEGSAATLPLSDLAAATLRAQKVQQDREAAYAAEDGAVGWNAEGYVFVARTGRPLDHGNVYRQWRRLLERAGVPYRNEAGRGRGLHSLRATFTTAAVDAGAPVDLLQSAGRWTTLEVPLRHYAATDRERLRGVLEGVAAAIGQGGISDA